MRDASKCPALSHMVPLGHLFSRWGGGDLGPVTHPVGRRLLCPAGSWGPLLPQGQMRCWWEMLLRKPWAERAGALGMSLRPEGAGGGARLLSAGSHLGLGLRDHSQPRHLPLKVPLKPSLRKGPLPPTSLGLAFSGSPSPHHLQRDPKGQG